MSTIKTWLSRMEVKPVNTNDEIITAMQAEITELREALKVAQAVVNIERRVSATMTEERDALQAKLSAIEAQEPVGHFMGMGEGAWSQAVGEAKYTKPLYAAPVAPAQPLTKEQLREHTLDEVNEAIEIMKGVHT